MERNARTLGNLRLESETARAELNDAPLDLTREEFRLVAALARFPGQVVPYEAISRMLWAEGSRGSRRSVLVYRLQEKLRPVSPASLEVVAGVGLRLGKLPATALACPSAL